RLGVSFRLSVSSGVNGSVECALDLFVGLLGHVRQLLTIAIQLSVCGAIECRVGTQIDSAHATTATLHGAVQCVVDSETAAESTAITLRLRVAAKRAAQSTSELGNGRNARQDCAGRYRK